jgi:hypothetical protein
MEGGPILSASLTSTAELVLGKCGHLPVKIEKMHSFSVVIKSLLFSSPQHSSAKNQKRQ